MAPSEFPELASTHMKGVEVSGSLRENLGQRTANAGDNVVKVILLHFRDGLLPAMLEGSQSTLRNRVKVATHRPYIQYRRGTIVVSTKFMDR